MRYFDVFGIHVLIECVFASKYPCMTTRLAGSGLQWQPDNRITVEFVCRACPSSQSGAERHTNFPWLNGLHTPCPTYQDNRSRATVLIYLGQVTAVCVAHGWRSTSQRLPEYFLQPSRWQRTTPLASGVKRKRLHNSSRTMRREPSGQGTVYYV
jgi:hypothetical protein